MKIKRELGTESLRELVAKASSRARAIPEESVRDPWPSGQRSLTDEAISRIAVRAADRTRPGERSPEVFVKAVKKFSPAWDAGIRPGDILVNVDDRPLKFVQEEFTNLKNGDKVRVVVFRYVKEPREMGRFVSMYAILTAGCRND